jgi:hypothetical protein
MCYNKGTKREEITTMTTYYFTAYQYEIIKDRVPHGEPEYYREDGIVCVKVKVNEDIFTSIALREGWI